MEFMYPREGWRWYLREYAAHPLAVPLLAIAERVEYLCELTEQELRQRQQDAETYMSLMRIAVSGMIEPPTSGEIDRWNAQAGTLAEDQG